MSHTRRKVLLSTVALAAAGLSVARAAPVASGESRRVIWCSIPVKDREQTDAYARKHWAGLFAPHGFIEGENLKIDVARATTLNLDPNPEWEGIARKVVASRPDLILSHMAWMPFLFELTREIPIVLAPIIDTDFERFLESARRPGTNVTGVILPLFGMQEKLFEILKELRPNARRAAVVSVRGRDFPRLEKQIRATAHRLGLEGFAIDGDDAKLPDRLADKLRAARIDLAHFLFGADEMHPASFRQMVELRVASCCFSPETLKAGHLVSYGALGLDEIAIGLAARILRGEAVSTLPAQQAQRFHFAVNLRTARALRIAIPPTILIRAQEVFE
jgi:putative ABC transport system substrate-binding protein